MEIKLPKKLAEDFLNKNYYEIPPGAQFIPHHGDVAGWAEYENALAVNPSFSSRIIDKLPGLVPAADYTPDAWLEKFTPPAHLRQIPFRKHEMIDQVSKKHFSQITFSDGWGDEQQFHCSVPYYYISPWNPGIVSDDSLIAVIAMNIDNPQSGNRVYVIRNDGKEAYCLLDNALFHHQICANVPYIHASPLGWVNNRTLFVAQTNGIACKIDVITGEIHFLKDFPNGVEYFISPRGHYVVCGGLGDNGKNSTVTYVYDLKNEQCTRILDINDTIKLHPEFEPDKVQITGYCSNFEWSPDESTLIFFSMLYYDGRIIRDLCRIKADGSDLGLVLSSEDTQRFPQDGVKRKFGEFFPSGSILNNHQGFLPNSKQILLCTQDPFGLPPGVAADETDQYVNTRFLAVIDLDGKRIQMVRGDDLNFDGHPSCNPQGTYFLGSDYHYFVKLLDLSNAHVTNLFSLRSERDFAHPHVCWSPDGRNIIWRNGKNGQLFTADISFIYNNK